MKNSNGKNGHKKEQYSERVEPAPSWRWPLAAYRNLQRLVFENQDELEKAVDLLWTDELYSLPHASPDGKSIVVPEEAVEYFTRAGLKFSAEKMRSRSDLTPEETRALRR